jgi:hypothetical protein
MLADQALRLAGNSHTAVFATGNNVTFKGDMVLALAQRLAKYELRRMISPKRELSSRVCVQFY